MFLECAGLIQTADVHRLVAGSSSLRPVGGCVGEPLRGAAPSECA